MRERHLLPIGADSDRDAVVEIDDTLVVTIGRAQITVIDDGASLQLVTTEGPVDATGDVVGEFARSTELDPLVADAVIGRWLARRHGYRRRDALWRRLGDLLPGLGRLQAEYPTLSQRIRLSDREVSYLRCADAQDAASAYWAEPCGRAAGSALVSGAVVTNTGIELSEARIGLMHLITDPALRREVSNTRTAHPVVVVPALETRSVTTSLSARAQVDFVRTALPRAESRQVIHAAHRLGITATGRRGADAYYSVAHQVRLAGFPRTSRLIDRLADEPIAGRLVRVINTADDTRRLGHTARNCLAKKVFAWPSRVALGHCQLAALENNGRVDAVLALSADGESVIDFRGPSNATVDPELWHGVKSRLSELAGRPFDLRPQDTDEPF